MTTTLLYFIYLLLSLPCEQLPEKVSVIDMLAFTRPIGKQNGKRMDRGFENGAEHEAFVTAAHEYKHLTQARMSILSMLKEVG